MITIDSRIQSNVSFLLFPDNQPHVSLMNVDEGEDVRLIHPVRSSLEMLHLLQIANALDHKFARKKELVIPYLMAARSDRLMSVGASVDLEVVARLVNSTGFQKVILFDVHSDVALQLIHRSVNRSNNFLLRSYTTGNSVLICPDAGASKKVDGYMKQCGHLSEVVYCLKKRDLDTGKVYLTVLEPELCRGRSCIVIDDICDGGATFTAIAEQIKPKHLTLMVSHGIFSKGLNQLAKHYQTIITSDSYQNLIDHKLTIVNCQGNLWI